MSSSGVVQAARRENGGFVALPAKVLDELVMWVAVSSIKSKDASLVALAFVCKRHREAVLGWLTTERASEVFQEGTSLHPFMAGFLVHKPSVLKQFPIPLLVEGELIGHDWEELLGKRYPLLDRWHWTLKQETGEVWPSGQISLPMNRCYCLSEECECLEVESNCNGRPTGLRFSASFSLTAGYEEDVLREMLEETVISHKSGVSRRWDMLCESLYNQVRMGASLKPKVIEHCTMPLSNHTRAPSPRNWGFWFSRNSMRRTSAGDV